MENNKFTIFIILILYQTIKLAQTIKEMNPNIAILFLTFLISLIILTIIKQFKKHI